MVADLAVQKALRARLVASEGVTSLVPAANILDRNHRPAPDPSIILGEAQVVDAGTIQRNRVLIYHTVHVWKKEASLEGVKAICWAVRQALRTPRLDLGQDYHAADVFVSNIRTLRDPDGATSHGVITVEILVQEMVG